MTHALRALLELNFSLAARENVLIFPLSVSSAFKFVFPERAESIFRRFRVYEIFGAVVLVFWLLRLF